MYDATGNQRVTQEPSGARATNTWDYENRMTKALLPAGIRNTMSYEPQGLRVQLEESTGTKKFVWDDQNYLAEANAANAIQRVYTVEPRTGIEVRDDPVEHFDEYVATWSRDIPDVTLIAPE